MSDTCAERILHETCKNILQLLVPFHRKSNLLTLIYSGLYSFASGYLRDQFLVTLLQIHPTTAAALLLVVARSKCLGDEFSSGGFFSCQTHLFLRCVGCSKYDFILLTD